jgi:GLPGLI family protein
LQAVETTFGHKLKNMKKIFPAIAATLFCVTASAQQKEGKVTYERVSVFEARFNINGAEQVMPQTRNDNFELHFANNQSLWKAVEKDNEEDAMSHDGGGVQVRMIVAGANDVLYTNFDTKKKTERKELFDKTFIVDDSVSALKWKMAGETKTILNHTCMKATTTQIRQTTRMTMDNGKMERKDVSDTSLVVAWFTSEIPVSAGPAEYQGQLPGLILEMDVNNGKQTFKAVAITDKPEVAAIKEPTGKKHYTPDEFKKEREKMMKEMQQNMQGGNRQIRIN